MPTNVISPSPDIYAVLAGAGSVGGTFESSSYTVQAPGGAATSVSGGGGVQSSYDLGQILTSALAGGNSVSGGGGGAQGAASGALQLSETEQIHIAIQQVTAAINSLITGLQAKIQAQGANAAPTAVAPTVVNGAAASAPAVGAQPSAAPGVAALTAAPAATGGGSVDPSTVKDQDKGGGLSAAAKRGVEEAHKFGLPLISGKRSGNGTSDHDSGNAIDISTLAIGSPGSTAATPTMEAYANHIRALGRAGTHDIKYVIMNGMIASGTSNNWEWRPYNVPKKSAGELAALKRSNPGEYNRVVHNDHVHISFNH